MGVRELTRQRALVAVLCFFAILPPVANAQQSGVHPTSIHTYKTVGTAELKAHVFMPSADTGEKLHPAIMLLHGGGWNTGSVEWCYDDAKRFAALGLVAIAGEYRLSDQKNITPLESMADARDLIRWVRQHAVELAVDPHRIAVYGISAGGHLAASLAVFPHEEESKISAVPDALILLSPAVSIANDHWPQTLLGSRAAVKEISPADNVAGPLPPMIIVEGAEDSVTPLVGVRQFYVRAKEFGGNYQILVYAGVGHLLTRNLNQRAQENGPFDPDPAMVAGAQAKENAFLAGVFYPNPPAK
jgi:acetyl esterase